MYLSARFFLLGYFIYFEVSESFNGEKALLYTPLLKYSEGGRCLRFWYHMYGSTTGSLIITTSVNTTDEVWHKSGKCTVCYLFPYLLQLYIHVIFYLHISLCTMYVCIVVIQRSLDAYLYSLLLACAKVLLKPDQIIYCSSDFYT